MIWAAVPVGFGTRTPGLGSWVNGPLGEMMQYSAGVRTIPRYPWLPPPKVVGTELAFYFSLFLRWCSVSYVGSPRIFVGTGCSK